MELTLQQLADIRLQAEMEDQLAVLKGWDDGRPMKLTRRQKPLPIPSPVAPGAPVSCISGNGAGGGVGTAQRPEKKIVDCIDGHGKGGAWTI